MSPKLPPIKISNELILAVGIIFVGLIAAAGIVMVLSVQSSTQTAVVFLYSAINQSNDTFKQDTNGHLLFLQNSIYGVSQSCNSSSQDSLRRINNLTESNANLKTLLDAGESRIDADEKKLDNLTAYIGSLNLNCTNTTTTVYVNQTIPAPVQNQTAPISCRQKIMNEHGLGPLLDLVACCYNSPPVGYSQECCACFQ